MKSAAPMPAVLERALGFLHGATDGVEIVAGGDYRKEQDQDATERAQEDERPTIRMVRRSPALPQQVRGQQ